MKKVIVTVLIGLCAFLCFWIYGVLEQKAYQSKSPFEVVPSNAGIIIESKNIKSTWSRLAETNLVYDAALGNPDFQKIDVLIKKIDSLFEIDPNTQNIFNNKSTVISFHPGDGIQTFVATSGTEKTFTTISKILEQYGVKKSADISGKKALVFDINEKNYFLIHLNPFIIFSTDALLIGNSIVQLKEQTSLLDDEKLKTLRATQMHIPGIQIYLNGSTLGSLFSKYLEKTSIEKIQSGNLLPSWSALSLNEKSNAIIVNGLSQIDAKNNTFENVKNQEALSTKSLWLLPTDLKFYKRSAISDTKAYLENNSIADIETISQNCDCDPQTQLSDWVKDEIISITFGNENQFDYAYLVGCSGSSNLSGQLSLFDVNDTVYKKIYDSDIYELKDKSFLKILGISDTVSATYFYARMNDFAVFSSYNGIAKIAYQWKASQASVPNNSFINFSQKLMANFSTEEMYFQWNTSLNLLKEHIRPEYHEKINLIKEQLSGINGLIWQASMTKNELMYHSLAINTNQGNEQGGAVQKLWNLSLQKNIKTNPQVMKNHQTGTNEIVVQDEANTLHLISATGKVKWFKDINEPIIGEIKQIDIYNNGKYQMLFNTATKIHLLDINGNEVTGFPIKLPATTIASNSVVVFDYDKNGDYRFLIATTDKKIYNYSKDGKPVQGWQPNPTESLVLNPIEHFVIDNKDYICINDINGKVYLLNRKGEPRESVNNKIATQYKENVFFQKGASLTTTKFIYLDSAERIVEMPLEGVSKVSYLDSTMYDFYHYTTDLDNDKLPDFIVSFGNMLSVFGPDKSLVFKELYDFDILQNIKSVGENHQYTIVANQKGNKIYLFNYQFKPVQGFPQKGTIQSTIGDLNKDGNQEVITILNGKEIVTYAINPLHGI